MVKLNNTSTLEEFFMKYKIYNLKDVVEVSKQEKFTVVSTFGWWWG